MMVLMGPFEFVVLFLSFIYTLALTHLLFAATRMLRHRRELLFSWPHALWMVNSLMLLVTNWLSLWDFHKMERVPLIDIALALTFCFAQYFVCALVSPDFEEGEGFDMRAFHARERRTYIGATLATFVLTIGINFFIAYSKGITSWASQNLVVLCLLPGILLGLLVRARWAQLLGPLSMMPGWIVYLLLYYPVLSHD